MKTPKRISVAKRPSAEQIKNSERWTFFLSQCAIDWDSLSEESRDFFCGMGHQEYTPDQLNELIDKAMGKNSGN